MGPTSVRNYGGVIHVTTDTDLTQFLQNHLRAIFKSGNLESWMRLCDFIAPSRQLTLLGSSTTSGSLDSLAPAHPLLVAVVARAMCESNYECLAAAEAVVYQAIARRLAHGELTSGSAKKFQEMTARMFSHCRLLGASCVQTMAESAEDWVLSPSRTAKDSFDDAAASTMRTRRAVVRSAFAHLRALGLTTEFPTIDLRLNAGASACEEVLTDQEVFRLLTVVAGDGSNRSEAALSLALLGAQPREIGQFTAADVDTSRSTVSLPDRILRVNKATLRALMNRQTYLCESSLIPIAANALYLAGSPTGLKPATGSSISQTLGTILRSAHCHPGVRPTALRAWVAQRLYSETRDLMKVKNALGERTLDRAAELAGISTSHTGFIDMRPALGGNHG